MDEQRPPVIDYEGSAYQADFWDRGEREYEDRVEAIALRRLLPPTGRLMLELGAGAGRNTPNDSEEEDELRPTIVFEADGSTDWAVLIIARILPEEELEETAEQA